MGRLWDFYCHVYLGVRGILHYMKICGDKWPSHKFTDETFTMKKS